MQKDFRDINKLISELNSQVVNYNAVAPATFGLTGSTSLDKIEPVEETDKAADLSSNVDATPNRGKTQPTLAGKSFSGTFGNATVNIEFTDGSFAVKGDIVGGGQWRQSGNLVAMDGKTSVYRGIITDKGIKGYRYFKDHRPYEEWSVVRDKAKSPLIGTTWVSLARTNPDATDPLLQWTDTFGFFKFRPGGKIDCWTKGGPVDDAENAPYTGYRFDGDTLYITLGGGEYEYKMLIKGDRMFWDDGRPFARRK